MNPIDPFEEQLRNQSLRPIPRAWKESLLPTSEARPEKNRAPFWTFLFQPYRYAYAALVLPWLGIALLHLNTPSSSPAGSLTSNKPALEAGSLTQWQEKHRYLVLIESNPNAAVYLLQ